MKTPKTKLKLNNTSKDGSTKAKESNAKKNEEEVKEPPMTEEEKRQRRENEGNVLAHIVFR